MKLIKIESAKHPGDIFLKIVGTKAFLGKIYASENAELYADMIIKTMKELKQEQERKQV
ncbi:MAG: hypothetical protein MUO31_06625 [Thermodesulfovibrionales bacterium]|nr:hypothetical protein [Thermodesulfovibrionales bacterium]